MYTEGPSTRTTLDGGTQSAPDLVSNNGSAKAVLNQHLQTSSENCDPNLRITRSGRKICETPLGVKEACVSPSSVAHLPCSPQSGGLVASDATGASPNQAKELSVRNGNANSMSSPTKVSDSPDRHHLGHGNRLHICRSPRCASNNPDYSAQTTPRKYLLSKRHMVPGAICTRDPSAVVKVVQDSPVASKPPKPIRKVENAVAQSSRLTSDESPSIKDALPPTRIPKPPGLQSPRPRGCTWNDGSKIGSMSGATVLKCLPAEHLGLKESPDSVGRGEDSDDSAEETVHLVHKENASNLLRVESDMSCSVLVASTSSEVFQEVNVSPPSDDPQAAHTGNVELTEISNDVEFITLENLHLPSSVNSTLCGGPESGPENFSERHDSPSRTAAEVERWTEAEVEDVAEKLAHDLVVEDRTCEETQVEKSKNQTNENDIPAAADPVEEGALHVEDCESVDDLPGNVTVTGVDDSRPRSTGCNLENADFPANTESGDVDGDRSSKNISSVNGDGGEQVQHLLAGQQVRDIADDCNDSSSEESEDYGTALLFDENVKETFESQLDVQASPEENVGVSADAVDGSQDGHVDTDSTSEGSIGELIANFESGQKHGLECQQRASKFLRGRGGQIWRSGCRDSREVVFLKPTSPPSRKNGDWTVDSVLEGAISKLNPSGEGRVRVLVEAFESLLALGGTDMPEKRASRVWCLNRMQQGELDEDGEEFEEGDQRVDCYEVAKDGLHLRASMRLSLGGGNRLPLCEEDETSEIEMSAIQKVEEWAGDSRDQIFDANSALAPSETCTETRSSLGGTSTALQDGHGDDQSLATEMYRISNHPDTRPTVHFADSCADDLSEFDRFSEDGSAQAYLKGRSYEPNSKHNFKECRPRRVWRATSVKSRPTVSSQSNGGSFVKERRPLRGTLLEPFHLVTEERGAVKEDQFARKLQDMFMEEERLRIPIAQGLPWTTDEPEAIQKPLSKEQTQPLDFKHYSNSRAIERADFDDYLARRSAYAEMQREEKERLRQLAEEEEIKKLRREMVPRAQLMPFFDKPFNPSRSTKRLTVPKEPTFHNREVKRTKCVVWQHR